MRAMFGLVGLLAVTGIGYYVYSLQLREVSNGKPLVQQVNLVAVRTDLLTLAQAERLYLATNSSYGTLEQLRQAANLNSLPDHNRGYVYNADVDGSLHFRITAKPADPARTDLKPFSIDETMQIRP